MKEVLDHALHHLAGSGFLAQSHQIDHATGTLHLDGVRTASKGFGSGRYQCQQEWPLDCAVQCGDDGMVITGKTTFADVVSDPNKAQQVLAGDVPHYKTAFFEAFPRNPDTFIRGEGATVAEAEAVCWAKYQKIITCPGHEFERRNRTDGYAYCRHCNLSGTFLPPAHPCGGCGATQYKVYAKDKDKTDYCEPCFDKLPDERLTDRCRKDREYIRARAAARTIISAVRGTPGSPPPTSPAGTAGAVPPALCASGPARGSSPAA